MPPRFFPAAMRLSAPHHPTVHPTQQPEPKSVQFSNHDLSLSKKLPPVPALLGSCRCMCGQPGLESSGLATTGGVVVSRLPLSLVARCGSHPELLVLARDARVPPMFGNQPTPTAQRAILGQLPLTRRADRKRLRRLDVRPRLIQLRERRGEVHFAEQHVLVLLRGAERTFDATNTNYSLILHYSGQECREAHAQAISPEPSGFGGACGY